MTHAWYATGHKAMHTPLAVYGSAPLPSGRVSPILHLWFAPVAWSQMVIGQH